MKGDNSRHPFDPQADLSQSRRKGVRKEGRKEKGRLSEPTTRRGEGEGEGRRERPMRWDDTKEDVERRNE